MRQSHGVDVGKGTTHEYKDTIHVVLQRMDLGLVVTLGFLLVKRPQRVGTIIKVPNHRLW